MGWKELPYWIKGGLIGLLVGAISFICSLIYAFATAIPGLSSIVEYLASVPVLSSIMQFIILAILMIMFIASLPLLPFLIIFLPQINELMHCTQDCGLGLVIIIPVMFSISCILWGIVIGLIVGWIKIKKARVK